MDPISDLFKTMRIAAVIHSRVEATAPWGLTHQATEPVQAGIIQHFANKISPAHLAHFGMIARGNCWLTVQDGPEAVPLTGGDCFLIGPGRSYTLRDALDTPTKSFCDAVKGSNVVAYGGGGAPTTIVSGLFSFETPSVGPMGRILPGLILVRSDQARTLALHTTIQLLASELVEGAPGSEVTATRLAEVLFIQTIRAHIAIGSESCKQGWLRAIFDPQIGTALKAVHDNVGNPWTVESLAAAAGRSRSAFAARFKELLGQTPLDYVTEWRMQKAIQLLRERDPKLVDVALAVGYESDAAFSKAFKRLVGDTPGEYRRSVLSQSARNGGEPRP